jgi:hypothetical protein
MIMKNVLYSGILILAMAGLGGCALNPLPNQSKEISNYLDRYKALGGEKALAYTKDENGQYVFGNAYDYTSQENANKRALKQCESRRKKLGLKKACEILAEGDKFLHSL